MMSTMFKIYFKGYYASLSMMFGQKTIFQAMLVEIQEQIFTCPNMKHILKRK